MKKLSVFLFVFIGTTLEFQASDKNNAAQQEVFRSLMKPQLSFGTQLGVLCKAVGINAYEIHNLSDEQLRKAYGSSDKMRYLETIIAMKQQPEFQEICASYDEVRNNPEELSPKNLRRVQLCSDADVSKKNQLHLKLQAARSKANTRSGRK